MGHGPGHTQNTGTQEMTFPTFCRTHKRKRVRERQPQGEGGREYWERVGVSKWEQSLYCFILHRKEEKEEKS